MPFWIQLGTPRTCRLRRADWQDLSHVLSHLYLWPAESAYVVFNAVAVPLCYKYDLYILQQGIRKLLSELSRAACGSVEIHFGSNTFNATWDVRWESDRVRVSTRWHAVAGGKSVEASLNANSVLEIAKSELLAEFAALLRHAIKPLRGVPLPRRVQAELRGLKKILRACPKHSYLYRPPTRQPKPRN